MVDCLTPNVRSIFSVSLRIVAIADIHYADGPIKQTGPRQTSKADILLQRSINRINRFIKPDLTVILGDLVDDASEEDLTKLKEAIDSIKSPCIVLPGNHDGDVFYKVFPAPPESLDIDGVRILSFVDEQLPEYNARRSERDIARMYQARREHDGPIISLQHVPLLPRHASQSPYRYTNDKETWEAFERNGFSLSVSGHWHPGDDLVAREECRAVVAPALCQHPFAFLEINVDGDNIQTRRHELAIPRELELIDYHIHTPFAYCSQNMEIPVTFELAEQFGLARFAFTEHSGQLYFERQTYWSAAFLDDALAYSEGKNNRMDDFIAVAKQHCPPAMLGLEIDCDNSGKPIVHRYVWDQIQVKLGSIHWLKALRVPEDEIDVQEAADEMVGRLSKFAASGIDILAHPLRVFRKWADEDLPANLIPGIVEQLRLNNVAAEINFHGQITTPLFLKTCLDAGVKVVFGSDSHTYYEIGEFGPHLDLIKACGLSYADLPNILANIGSGEG